jgi:hypothetical protein
MVNLRIGSISGHLFYAASLLLREQHAVRSGSIY